MKSRRLMISRTPRTKWGIKRISHFGSRIVPFKQVSPRYQISAKSKAARNMRKYGRAIFCRPLLASDQQLQKRMARRVRSCDRGEARVGLKGLCLEEE
jgi:hypothetical protein